MQRRLERSRGGVGVLMLVATLAVAALGWAVDGWAASGTPAHTAAGTVDPAARSLLPASIRSASVLTDGIQAPNPPMEYSTGGSSNWIGFDIDIAKALAAKLGVKTVRFDNQAFTQLLPSLQTGRVDLVTSAITDKKSRQGIANFIDYFITGAALFTSKANLTHASTVGALCGQTIEVNVGTSYVQDIQALSASVCKGKAPMKEIVVGGTIADQELQIRTGRAIAAVTAPENVGYLGTVSPGNWVQIGKVFATAPYGIAVAKANHGLLAALTAAFRDIYANGTYATIATKWHLRPSEVKSVVVDGGK